MAENQKAETLKMASLVPSVLCVCQFSVTMYLLHHVGKLQTLLQNLLKTI